MRLISWFSRDVRKKLIKIKILSFQVHQVKVIFKHTLICWPVFNSVDCFVLKVEHRVFSQCMTSALFLGNKISIRLMLRGVPMRMFSSLTVGDLINREKKRFERAKVNSRCFHQFPLKLGGPFTILNLCKTTDLKIACLSNLVVGVVKCRILANTKRAEVFLLANNYLDIFYPDHRLRWGTGSSNKKV